MKINIVAKLNWKNLIFLFNMINILHVFHQVFNVCITRLNVCFGNKNEFSIKNILEIGKYHL